MGQNVKNKESELTGNFSIFCQLRYGVLCFTVGAVFMEKFGQYRLFSEFSKILKWSPKKVI